MIEYRTSSPATEENVTVSHPAPLEPLPRATELHIAKKIADEAADSVAYNHYRPKVLAALLRAKEKRELIARINYDRGQPGLGKKLTAEIAAAGYSITYISGGCDLVAVAGSEM